MIYRIDCSCVQSPQQLHQLLAEKLCFPEWYGHNLDALYDCLTELPSPTQLHLCNWDHNQPWSTGFEVLLTDAQEFSTDLTVVYE